MTPYSINKKHRYYAALAIFFICAYLQPTLREGAKTFLPQVPAQLLEAVSVVLLISITWWLFDNFLWLIPEHIKMPRSKWIKMMPLVPNFSGRWVGYIDRRAFEDDGAGGVRIAKESNIPIELHISQTFSDISIAMKSYEFGVDAGIIPQDLKAVSIAVDQRATSMLNYCYSRHNLRGETSLVMQESADGHMELKGTYISDKPRSGILSAQRVRSGVWVIGRLAVLHADAGSPYLGVMVEANAVRRHLKCFESMVGKKKYRSMRDRQIARDGAGFHITIVDPLEYTALGIQIADGTAWQALGLGSLCWFCLEGLGSASDLEKKNEAYFVVATSFKADELRMSLGLRKKYLHVTLGFMEADVHGVNKGPDTIVGCKLIGRS